MSASSAKAMIARIMAYTDDNELQDILISIDIELDIDDEIWCPGPYCWRKAWGGK